MFDAQRQSGRDREGETESGIKGERQTETGMDGERDIDQERGERERKRVMERDIERGREKDRVN